MANKAMKFMLAMIAFYVVVPASAATVSVHVTDASGAAIPNILLIVKSINGYREPNYSLSDSLGKVVPHDCAPGIYQLIATQPYGLWKTQIQEFLVKDAPVSLEVRLETLPTHGLGDVAVIGPQADVTIVDRGGKPASEAQIFVRDSDAKFGEWYKAGKGGKVRVQTFGQGSVFVTYYEGNLTTFTPHELGAQKDSVTNTITLRLP